MKKLNSLILSLAVLLAAGCGKEDDQQAPATNPDNISNQKCQLLNIEYTDGADVFSTGLDYNAAGQIVKFTTKENGTVNEITTVSYNSAGQVIKTTEDNGTYYTYEYNTNGLLTKKSKYVIPGPGNPAIPMWFLTYEYNNDKKLVKRTEYDAGQGNAVLSYVNFTYPTATSARLEGYTVNTGFNLSYTHDYTYDDKIGLNAVLGVLSSHFGPFSDHNVLTENYHAVFSSTIYNIVNTYEYNPDGYPTKQTTMVNGALRDVYTFTYNCK